jgi:hypothetical protein
MKNSLQILINGSRDLNPTQKVALLNAIRTGNIHYVKILIQHLPATTRALILRGI